MMISAKQMMICVFFTIILQFLLLTLFSTSFVYNRKRRQPFEYLQQTYTDYHSNDSIYATLGKNSLRTVKTTENNTIMVEIPFKEFKYPSYIDYRGLVRNFMEKGYLDIPPLNTYRYQYLSFAKDKCKYASKIFLLVLVKSAVANFQRRHNIRKTWGNESVGTTLGMKTVFLLGSLSSAFIQSRVDDENRLYRDIVQIDFIDNYYNNTLKTYGGFKWIQQYCKSANFVLAVDDDYFVAPERVEKYLSSLGLYESEGLYMGHIGNRPPQRVKGKWYIPVTDYPFDLYPPFISGGATLISRQVALEISIVMPYTKLFKYDDVYLGIILYKLGREASGNKFMYVTRLNNENEHEIKNVLAAHGYADDLVQTWELYMRLEKKNYKL